MFSIALFYTAAGPLNFVILAVILYRLVVIHTQL